MTLHIASVADLSELTRSQVHNIRIKAANKFRVRRHPLALSNEQGSEFCLMIHEKALAGNYVTKMELLNYIKEHFGVSLTYGWIRCFLQRRAQLGQK
jgi:transposase